MALFLKIARRVSFVLVNAVVFSTYANGDPVAIFSSVNRVANPEPLSISEIYILSETINITHVDGYNCFDITYEFKNTSNKAFPNIQYGFPIDYCVADELETYRFVPDYITESIFERGWNEKLIKDISFTYNDKTLPFQSSKESVREAGYTVEGYSEELGYGDTIPIEAINRRWFYTEFAMKPHAKAKFNVRYKVYANNRVGLNSDKTYFSYYARETDGNEVIYENVPFIYRYFYGGFNVIYDFTPAKHFGNGKPYLINVNIDFTNLTDPVVYPGNGYTYYAKRIERRIYEPAGEIQPLTMLVNFQSDNSENKVNQMIDSFAINDSEYNVKLKKNEVTINFRKPMFVSEVVCDMDTVGVKAIQSVVTYADGKHKHYKYAPEELMPYISYDSRIKTPVILTITDLYQYDILKSVDDIYCLTTGTADFKEDKFKIKKIKLVFDTDSTAVSMCKDIKVLDARFINQP